MTEFLLHLRNATKVSTGTYVWDFSHQNEVRPRRLTIGPVNVTCPTNLKNVVILSDTFTRNRKQHTLRGDNLRNVLCVVHPEQRVIRSTSSSSSVTTGISDSLISDIGSDLLMWLDFHPSRVLDSTFQNCENAGDICYYYYNRTPAPASLLFVNAYGTGLQLANVGQTKGVTRVGGWESVVDGSSAGNPALAEEFTVHLMITMPSTLGAGPEFFILASGYMWITATGTGGFKIRNRNNSTVLIPNIAYVPLRTYILSVQRRIGTQDNTGDGNVDDYEFSWRLEDISSGGNGVQVDISERGADRPANGLDTWQFGRSSTNFDQTQSCAVAYNGVNATDYTNTIAWLKAQYTGDTEQTTVTETTANSFQLYDSRQKTIRLNEPHTTLKQIQLRFEDDTGALFDPESGTVHISAN